MGAPNFTLLDSSLPEIGRLISAMLQARDAVERRLWSHPQEPTSEDWWAGVLADPRGRKRERRTDLAVKQALYRLADEKRETILVACSKCDWRAALNVPSSAPQLTARPLDAFVASSARIIYYLFIFSRERVVFKFFLSLRDERDVVHEVDRHG
jgi:hypothetical protein